MTEVEQLREEMTAILKTIGLVLVEMKGPGKSRLPRFVLTVYSEAGTGIDECTRAHRLIQSNLEKQFGKDGFDLEVSSPGINRELSSLREYQIFCGRWMNLHLENGDDYSGRLVKIDGETLHFENEERAETFPWTEIKKGRLDSTIGGK